MPRAWMLLFERLSLVIVPYILAPFTPAKGLSLELLPGIVTHSSSITS